jgi:hypothetical protein
MLFSIFVGDNTDTKMDDVTGTQNAFMKFVMKAVEREINVVIWKLREIG